MLLFPQPPWVLIVVGLFAGITCGLAFEATLKEEVRQWSQTSKEPKQGIFMLIPFLGICLGVCLFLAAGLETFGFTTKWSYVVALPLTLFMGFLIWSQLGKLLQQLQRGGSRAIDLDAFE
ncbi:MAG: hypothetical protein ACOC0N_05530 [Chroococcales cyanobacterium]